MKENKYDDKEFFEAYGQMMRSQRGLDGAGEWHVLRGMLPPLEGVRVLDLGCGYGWHCRYAAEQGAAHVLGTDISARMIEVARKINAMPQIEYRVVAIEDLQADPESYDVVLSSLTFHYLESFDHVAQKIFRWLAPGGTFVFSVEHPVFTAYGTQDWYRDAGGDKLHWPVDNYFTEGRRVANFLDNEVVKYHKTLTTYVNGLLRAGFQITELIEPEPSAEMLAEVPEMKEELRRPMMLLISAVKG